VSDHSHTLLIWLRSHLGPLVGVGALLALIGYGCYVGGSNVWAWYQYRQAETALEHHQLDEARTRLDKCLKIWKRDADTHFLAARVARRLRDFEQAERHLDVCKKQGMDERVQLERAMMLAQRESPATVEGYLMAEVRKDNPDSSLILEALIQGYLKTYQLPQAHHCANLWLERDADNPQALFWRGMLYEKVLNNRGAAEDFKKVVAADPENGEARLHLADLLLGFKEYQDAVEHYEWLDAREPGNMQVMLGLAGCRVALSQLDEAQKLLDDLLAAYPRNPLVLAECGKLALKMGKPDDAEASLRRSVEIDPYEPEAVFSFSQVLQLQGKSSEATKWRNEHERILADLNQLYELNKAIIAAPRDPKLRYEIGQIFMRNGREQEGLRWLGTALQMDPRHRPTHKTLAEYCERKGMTREAAYHREQAK
jgi:tetratricopeptide (TPR) repeat protein